MRALLTVCLVGFGQTALACNAPVYPVQAKVGEPVHISILDRFGSIQRRAYHSWAAKAVDGVMDCPSSHEHSAAAFRSDSDAPAAFYHPQRLAIMHPRDCAFGLMLALSAAHATRITPTRTDLLDRRALFHRYKPTLDFS
ncbi:MAG: hypothetical protein R8G34_08675 [Paracoccaceae bacterium]|nr:hypothetical protein [Paracoccaceae bacterium]